MKQRILITLVVLLLVPVARAQVYTITDLGSLSPAAINNLGQIAAVNLQNHTVLWTTGHVRDLGVLPGGAYSIPSGINDVGAVVGVADGFVTWNSQIPDSPYYLTPWTGYVPLGFVWTSSNGMKSLGFIDCPFGEPFSLPYYQFNNAAGINIFGKIIEYSACGEYVNGYVWTHAAGPTMLIPYTYNSEAIGINNRGQVVGWNGYAYTRDNHRAQASLWENGVLTELGSLLALSDPYFEEYGSVAYDINDSTHVVGWSAYNLYNSGSFSDYVPHAFLWTQPDGMKDLGTLPGDLSSIAQKINLSGQVIGTSYAGAYWNEPGNKRPFVWTKKGGMQDVNTLILANAGWVLQSVADINIWGQIVGQGTRNGQPHGFLLTPKNFF